MFTSLILGAIASGLFALYKLAKLIWNWLKERLREKKLKEKAPEVFTIDIRRLRKEAELNLSYDDLESILQLEREGKTHLIIGLDHSRNMTGKVDLIEAENVDETVAMHLRRGDGMFVA